MTTKRRHTFPKMKGIEAFLSSPIEENSSNVASEQTILVEKIQLPDKQPRRYFAPEKMTQLIESVKTHGILEPLLVRPLEAGGYELVAGERRFRAAVEAQFEQVPVSIRELDDREALQIALIENLHREDLNPIEETEGILQLLELQLGQDRSEIVTSLYRMQANAKGKSYNVIGQDKVEQVFSQLAMSWESFTANRLPLLNLPSEVLESLREGKIAYTKAQAIGRVKNDAIRSKLLRAAVKDDLSLTQIRDRIKSLRIEQQKQASSGQVLVDRFEILSRRLKKAKVWEDETKKQAFEDLLEKFEALLV